MVIKTNSKVYFLRVHNFKDIWNYRSRIYKVADYDNNILDKMYLVHAMFLRETGYLCYLCFLRKLINILFKT